MKLSNVIGTARSVFKVLNLIGLYILRSPKELGGLCEPLLDFHEQKSKSNIKQGSIEEFTREEYGHTGEISSAINIPIITGTRGITLGEAFSLAILVKLSNAHTCFEIGTYKGWSSHYLAAAMGENGIVYTLDLNPGQKAGLEVKERDEYGLSHDVIGYTYKQCPIHKKQVIQLFGDSALFDYSPYIGRIDIVFIDGAHSAKYIQIDTSNAFEMAHEGTMIVWHDYKYACPEVIHYLSSLGKSLKLWHIQNTSFIVHKVNMKEKVLIR